MTEARTSSTQRELAHRIVVGFDGSEGAVFALDWAAAEAGRTDSVLEVHAAYPAGYSFVTSAEVKEEMSRLAGHGVDHVREVAPNVVTKAIGSDASPVAALVEASMGADLLVVGSRGLGGFRGLVLGSVSHKCALHAHCPVVVVRPTGRSGDELHQPRQPLDRIVVGVDGSPSSTDALRWAFSEAERAGGIVAAVSCWIWPTKLNWAVPTQVTMAENAEAIVRDAVEPLKTAHPGVQVETKVIPNHPAPALVAESERARIVVVGSRGHGEFVGSLLGSVSEYCVSHACCPVLVMRDRTTD
jgi:nucleotide-binding universal stress UspA family protein